MDKTVGTKLARKGIDELIAYIPGKPMEEVQQEYGLTEIIKMASNENPVGTSPKAIEAMIQALRDTNLYPEGSSRKLRQRVAANFGIDENMVIFSNGADNILALIGQGFIDEGDEVIIGDPTFSVYETVTKIMGGKIIKVPLKEFTYDLTAIAQKITNKTKLIFICNPNNPTGTIVTEEETARFMELVPEHCVVVFDEAYAEFVGDKSYPQTIKYVKAQRNVLIVRTLSKLYGLAGIRVGYAIGPEQLMDILRKVVEPFPVNRLAQAGGLAALDDTEFLQKVVSLTEQGRQYLYQEFTKMGMAYALSNTNFILVNLGLDAQTVFKELLKKGIIIRPGNIWGLSTYARITIGTMEQNEKLIKALNEIVSR